MAADKILVVITTCDKRQDADMLASGIVEKKLAACAQVSGPITSYYWWEGSLEQAQEWQVKIKTTLSKYGQVEEFIKTSHPYDLPQVVGFPAERASNEFSQWVAEITEQQ